MPVKTAIHRHLRCMAKENLDSGMRRNDEFRPVGLWPGPFRK
jgi:hypothetical protein